MIKVNNILYFYRSINPYNDSILVYDNKYRDFSRGITIKRSTGRPQDSTFNVTHLYPVETTYSIMLWRF